MKKAIIIMALAVMPILANAQWSLGGSLEMTAKHINGSDVNYNSGWGLNPYVGYQLKENVEVLLGLSAGQWTSDIYSGRYSKYNYWGFAPRVRWTFAHAGKFSAFLDGELSFRHTNGTAFSSISNISLANEVANQYQASIYPGVKYELNDRLSLVANMSFMHLSASMTIDQPDGNVIKTSTSVELPVMGISNILNETTLGIQVNF